MSPRSYAQTSVSTSGSEVSVFAWGDFMMILCSLVICFMLRNVCSISKMSQGAGPEPGSTGPGLCSVSVCAVCSGQRGPRSLYCCFCWIGFFASLKKEGFFPFPSPSLEAILGILLAVFWGFVPFKCFRLGLFFFSARLGSQQDCPEPELNQQEKGH